jgi:hypothetical protein
LAAAIALFTACVPHEDESQTAAALSYYGGESSLTDVTAYETYPSAQEGEEHPDVFNQMLVEEFGQEFMENHNRSLRILDELNEHFFQSSTGDILYPSYIGGVFLNDNGHLTIQIVAARANDAADFLSELDQWVLIEEVTFSQRELNQTSDILWNNRYAVLEFSNGWGIDTINNSVVVDLTRYSEDEILRFREEVLDSPMITFRDPFGRGQLIDGMWNEARPLRVYPQLESNVTMTVTEVNSDSVTISINNESDLPLFTGNGFGLEVYYNGLWLNIPNILAFTSEGISIFTDEPLTMQKNLQVFLHLMEPGSLYRIRKDVMIDTWLTDEFVNDWPARTPVETIHDVVAEFVWN